MYQAFYNMRVGPFPTQPMPEVFFKSKTHAEALSFIQQGIREHESFLLVTGEYGLGKTLLCLRLMKAFHQNPGQFYFVYIPTANYTYEMMLKEMNNALGFDTTNDTRMAILQSNLFDFYKKKGGEKRRFFIVIDDFQEIDSSTLQHLKLLANFNTEDGFFPFSLILFAHPVILDRLKPPLFVSLQQKIKRHFRLTPFNYEETREYIYFRLLYSGAQGKPFFTEEAAKYIYQLSKGNPRFINNICDASLMVGSKMGKDRIEKKIVAEAASVLAQSQKNEKFLASHRRSDVRPVPPPKPSEERKPAAAFMEQPAASPRKTGFLHEEERKIQRDFSGQYDEPPTAEVDFTNISGRYAPPEKRQGSLGVRLPSDQWGIDSLWGKKVVRWFVWGVILVLIALLFYRYRNVLLGKVSGQPMRYKIDRNYMDEHTLSKSSMRRIFSKKGSGFSPVSLSNFQESPVRHGKGQDRKDPMDKIGAAKGQVRDTGTSQDILIRNHTGLKTRLLFREVTRGDLALPMSKERGPDTGSGIAGEKGSFYSLILSSHLDRSNAMEEIAGLKRGKLFPIFLKKLAAHGRTWWVIFQGTYENRRMAEEVKALYHFSNAIVKKVPAQELKGALTFVGPENKDRYCQKQPRPLASRGVKEVRGKGGLDVSGDMDMMVSPWVLSGLNHEAIYSLLRTCYDETKQGR